MEFTKLKKGSLIDAQPGFVDSWNRMVDCWNNLVGRGKAKVEWPDDRTPTVNVPDDDDDDDDEENESREDEDDTDDIPDIELPPFDPRQPSEGGGSIKFVGTDLSEATIGEGTALGEVHFASEANSMVTATVSKSGDNVTVTLGIRYK